MLGRQHLLITLGISSLLIIPFFFENSFPLIHIIAFLIAVSIGSLTPDADARGNAMLHYSFWIVDEISKKVIIPLTVLAFAILTPHKVRGHHREIMHSPIGILISSTILMIPLLFLFAFTGTSSITLILALFLGLLIGQFLHLIEDSCTISGINWKFPFGYRKLKGSISTGKSSRPDFFIILTFTILAASIIPLSYLSTNIGSNLLLNYLVSGIIFISEIFIILLISDTI